MLLPTLGMKRELKRNGYRIEHAFGTKSVANALRYGTLKDAIKIGIDSLLRHNVCIGDECVGQISREGFLAAPMYARIGSARFFWDPEPVSLTESRETAARIAQKYCTNNLFY